MNKNRIEIAIVLQSGQRAQLHLSPSNYKQNFRDFLKKYHIQGEQANKLKKVIQLSLVEISKMRFQSFPKYESRVNEQIEQQKQFKTQQQIQHHIESPRFKKPLDEGKINLKQPYKTNYQIDKTEKKQKMNHELPDQEVNIEDIPIISVQNIKNIHQEKAISVREKQQYPQDPQQQLYDEQELPNYPEDDRQQPYPAIPPSKLSQKGLFQGLKSSYNYKSAYLGILQTKNIQKYQKDDKSLPKQINKNQKSLYAHKKKQNNPTKKINQTKSKQHSELKFKKHQKCLSQDRSTYDRLYYQHTDSFRSKKNQQINRKQIQDQIQVQKYELNNQLKRTNKQFFYDLHKRTTESWSNKQLRSKQKSQQEQVKKQYSTLPTKKVSIENAFKGSLWQSRSRCEAHSYQEKIKMQQKKIKLKQQQILKRIRQNKGRNPQKKKSQHQSRSCQKCSPKKMIVKERKEKRLPQTQQRIKKNYISQVLKEAYQQRIRQVKVLSFL